MMLKLEIFLENKKLNKTLEDNLLVAVVAGRD